MTTLPETLSARNVASAFLGAKSPATRAALVKVAADRAHKRLTWARLERAMREGDLDRVAYYAASGDERRERAKALTSAPKPAKDAPAKAPTKPAKAKPAKARAKAPANAPDLATAAKALGVDEAKLAAFLALVK